MIPLLSGGAFIPFAVIKLEGVRITGVAGIRVEIGKDSTITRHNSTGELSRKESIVKGFRQAIEKRVDID